MTDSITKDIIRSRKSVRTFDGTPLRAEDLRKLEEYAAAIRNPFDVPVEFRFLDAKENNVSSPVVVGEQLYVAAKVKRTANFEVALGYSFEELCLYAASLGIGTVVLAATLSRKSFEQAMQVVDGEVMPVVSPLGYAAPKRSIREGLMRKGIGSDSRKDFGSLFFNGSFGEPLTEAEAGPYGQALENLRWAPSATNKQPWRAVKTGSVLNFYELQTLKPSPLGDIQKVDVGIALANFALTMEADGVSGRFEIRDPGISHPENAYYLVSYTADSQPSG